MSAAMLKKLDQQAARNEPEDLTIQAFVQEYGEQVLAQPPGKGFSLAAWVMPGAAAIIGLVVVFTVLRLWRRRTLPAQAAPSIPPELIARARRQADLESEE
jgi:cytochrome c-type biogenesis protein CcmH